MTYRVAWVQGEASVSARMHGDDLPAAVADFEALIGDPYVKRIKLEQYHTTGGFTLHDGGRTVEPVYRRQTLRRWRREDSVPAQTARPRLSLFDLRRAMKAYDNGRLESPCIRAATFKRLRELLTECGVDLHTDT